MTSGRRRSKFLRVFLTGLAFLALVSNVSVRPGAAQVLYGSVIGTVTDSSGGVVPSASITLTSKETGSSRSTNSDEGGRYSLVNVMPGRYDIKVTGKGFRTFDATDFEVVPDTVGRFDIKLEVGQITETVTVSAEAAALQTDKADTHSVIETGQVTALPLNNYRNYQELLNLVPGTTPASLQNSITDTPQRALHTNVNGGPGQTNITRIDGVTSVNVWLPHHVGYVTPEETVEVVNVTTTAADAEQGMAGASAITLVTKSGTNDIHGSAFEFHDDQHLKARNFFQAPGTPIPLSINNDFGGTIGGPIRKSRLFYFLSYESTRQRTASPAFYTVPTAALEAGNFSGTGTTIYNPLSGNPDGTGRTPFAGNVIPTTMLNPIALKLQSYYPSPNVGTSAFTNNLTASGGPILDRQNVDTKINYHQSDKEDIWGKYSRMWATSGGKAVFGLAGGPGLGGSDPGLGNTLVQLGAIGQTRTLTPHLLLDSVFGYERQGQHVFPNDYGTNYGLQFGIPNTNGPDPLQSGFPNIAVSGYTGFGVPNWMPLHRVEESYTNSDNLTWTKGAHELRFGFDLVRHHLNHWQPEIGQGPRGYLGFGGGETALAPGSPNQFNAYAAFLLGYSDDAEKSLQYILMTGREWQFGWYARDRWQVNRNLTINIGLRYEYYPLMTRAGYGIERYDPNSNNVFLGGRGGQPEDVGITVSHKLFSPRIGLAYRLGEKTVIRVGYGLNYDPIPFSRPLRGWYPLTVNFANLASNGYAWSTTFQQGVPNAQGPNIASGVVPLPGNASERSPWGGEVHRGYVQSYNFTIEQKLPENIIGSVAYVGTHTVHILADRDINYGSPGSGTTGLPYYASYGRTLPLNMWDGYLSAEYNSLQVAVNRSFSKGLMIKGAYTYSKAIDYTDDDGWVSTGWNWPAVFQRNRAPAGYDRTHILAMGWVYTLPIGKGRQFLNNSKVADAVLGHWAINGITSAYTGTPFTVGAPGSSLNAPNNTQTADQIAPVQLLGQVGPGSHYYATSSFAPVTAVRFGSSGRNILRNPGLFNTDLDITREFPLKERIMLQFRGEFFNIANDSHFGGVSTSVTSGSFMQITSASGERQIRLGLRLHW